MKYIKQRLIAIYGETDAQKIWTSLKEKLLKAKQTHTKERKQRWDEKDLVLITYSDQFQEEGKPALATFEKVFDRYLADNFEIVHLLPFYPYSSDDGFSVIDYKKVNPIAGNWEDVEQLSKKTRIMFDYVCNHISAQSDWFKEYIKGSPEYADFFTEMDPDTDLSAVTRPRSTPVLTKFKMEDGSERYIWTTFSEDQIDLNFKNPNVLLKMIDVLLFYIEHGAEYIRLDAVGFMWKEIGSTCIHLEKTHQIIKLFRDIVEEVAKGTVIITETNVPHKDNISYFGNGSDEAHMVYQFPLPPLVLYTINRGDGSALTNWARNLQPAGDETTFFNFLASHDGIGLNPIRGIIPEEEILALVSDLKEEGAKVNYKKNPDNTQSPYEVNVTYLDALNKRADDDDIRMKRFLSAHSILLSLQGVPAIYIQSILGSRNDYDGVAKTGMNRSINRQKYGLDEIETELTKPGTLRSKIYRELTNIIQTRKAEALFHPDVPMEVLDKGERIFALKRGYDSQNSLTIIHNIANEQVDFQFSGEFVNIITGEEMTFVDTITLDPYQFLWLKSIN
ncbi:sugar phosphorylase [Peribacillus muralis]|uniref:sugar phosphorylase n=1 Tax=Peribacillus muralis TaxID=264697 RepID=UPI001F4E6D06|nr:sugar phosphorylase [Peribacillus muralis]MCK1992791.1 sugar phosphorylase [Peribacillus muralis]MCK2013346.1 sugar phosphorylase [Peribacillus muralis]